MRANEQVVKQEGAASPRHKALLATRILLHSVISYVGGRASALASGSRLALMGGDGRHDHWAAEEGARCGQRGAGVRGCSWGRH